MHAEKGIHSGPRGFPYCTGISPGSRPRNVWLRIRWELRVSGSVASGRPLVDPITTPKNLIREH
ncbi:unnamed protein product [Clonostachys rosea f. rosea IK726]|uniref:Uncharacterized protein n=2 Tax=Bionectria ochroleuca TaxID=29856 RepID=A0A0B7KLY3_BIOOC|nr:unnamed protein product [Clonostachys rosea f. rosea IK726]